MRKINGLFINELRINKLDIIFIFKQCKKIQGYKIQ